MRKFVEIIVLIITLQLLNSCGSLFEPRYSGLGDYATCVKVKGYWSNWDPHYLSIYNIKGSYSDFSIVDADRPWDVYCRILINNYQYKKSDTYVVFSGYLEYYVNEAYPTIEKQFNTHKWFCISSGQTANHLTKRKANATIYIEFEKYGKDPKVYYIHFDGVAFGLDISKFKS